jgi:hypothetical protein
VNSKYLTECCGGLFEACEDEAIIAEAFAGADLNPLDGEVAA